MKCMNSFAISNVRCYQLLRSQDNNFSRLNKIWGYTKTDKKWHQILHLIWISDLSLKANTFLWTMLAQGLFSGTRALKIGISNGECLLCAPSLESIPHIFFNCIHARCCWTLGTTCFGGALASLWSEPLAVFGLISGKTPSHLIRLFLFFHIAWQIWLSRNEQTFNFVSCRTFDLTFVLSEMIDHIHGVTDNCGPGRQHTRLLRAKEEPIYERTKWLLRTDSRLLSPSP